MRVSSVISAPFRALGMQIERNRPPQAPSPEIAETSITIQRYLPHAYAAELDRALSAALDCSRQLSAAVMQMEGMSGRKYRRFINGLIAQLPTPRYLEVGSWRGSTVAAAIDGNTLQATCIDNWSEFEGSADAFKKNVSPLLTGSIDLRLIESDFRKVDYGSLGAFNVFLFDGPHEIDDQRDGIVLAQAALDDEYILIVDDWNWHGPREGTFAGITAANLDVCFSIEIRTAPDDDYPGVAMEKSDWHNGYFIVAVRKRGRAQAVAQTD